MMKMIATPQISLSSWPCDLPEFDVSQGSLFPNDPFAEAFLIGNGWEKGERGTQSSQ